MRTQSPVKAVAACPDVDATASANDNTGPSISRWMRFLFEKDEGLRCYEVCLSLPNLGKFAEPFDLRVHVDADKLSFSEVVSGLRRCAESHDDVEKVSLHLFCCCVSPGAP